MSVFHVKRRLRSWGYRLRLIRYCVLCDGSLNEARERGRPFRADRWVWHRRHERLANPGPLL